MDRIEPEKLGALACVAIIYYKALASRTKLGKQGIMIKWLHLAPPSKLGEVK